MKQIQGFFNGEIRDPTTRYQLLIPLQSLGPAIVHESCIPLDAIN
jgi:hypothetical protein